MVNISARFISRPLTLLCLGEISNQRPVITAHMSNTGKQTCTRVFVRLEMRTLMLNVCIV